MKNTIICLQGNFNVYDWTYILINQNTRVIMKMESFEFREFYAKKHHVKFGFVVTKIK